jgi:hypothetical protein
MRMEASVQQQPASSSHTSSLSPADPRERKPVHNASSKVSLVVQRMLFPMLDSPMRTHVVLDVDAHQPELDLLDEIDRAQPGATEDHGMFVQHLVGLLERYRRSQGYTRVRTASSQDGGPC